MKAGFNEFRLNDSFTLVNSNKNIVYYSQLSNLKIHTYLDKKEVKDFLGNIDNVVFHKSIEDINSEEIFLIDWKDYNDSYELLIPIDENNLKVKKFRIPVLYLYGNIDKFKSI